MVKGAEVWRKNLSKIIDEELVSLGLKEFDGISYSFPVSDEILGVVQVLNQPGFHSEPPKAHVLYRLGFIHYQLNTMCSTLCEMPRFNMWQWTIGDNAYNKLGVSFASSEFYKAQSLSDQRNIIQEKLREVREIGLSFVRSKFENTKDIVNFLEQQQYPEFRIYCIALLLLNQPERTHRLLQDVNSNQSSYRFNPPLWLGFKAKLDLWLCNDNKLPTVEVARMAVHDSADARKKQIENIPFEQRPTF